MSATRKKATRKKATRKKTAAKPRPRPRRKKATASRTPPAGPAGGDPLDYCPGCQHYKPVSGWALAPGEDLPAGAFVCADCRRAKRRPREDYLPQLSGRSRSILRDLLVSRSIGDTAKRHGLSPQQVTNLVRGRKDRRDRESELVRAAWQEMLVLEGLDLLTIARIARLTLHATKPYWNKAEARWDFFPDHMSRIQSARWLVRLHGADPTAPRPPYAERLGGAAVIMLDLGTDRTDPAPDAFTVARDVTPEKRRVKE